MIVKILKEEGCPPWVIEHSIAVCKKAKEISKNFDVDGKLIEEGALLHDIGRSKTNSIDHGIIGAKLAIKHGFPKEIADIIERHIGSGISKEEAVHIGLGEKNYIPETIEEKIVAHADNLMNGGDEVDIAFVAKKWEKSKIVNLEESLDRLKKQNKEIIEDFD